MKKILQAPIATAFRQGIGLVTAKLLNGPITAPLWRALFFLIQYSEDAVEARRPIFAGISISYSNGWKLQQAHRKDPLRQMLLQQHQSCSLYS